MAGKKKQSVGLPERFVPLQSDLVGFFKLEPGNRLIGILQARVETKGGKYGPKAFYRIDVTEGTTKVLDKKKEKIAGEGESVGIDEKGWLKSLARVELGTEVAIFYDGLGKAEEGRNAPHLFIVGKAEPIT